MSAGLCAWIGEDMADFSQAKRRGRLMHIGRSIRQQIRTVSNSEDAERFKEQRVFSETFFGHLDMLPPGDACSREIVSRMREDEARHGATGRDLGARELPAPVKAAMRIASRIMTRTAYWI